MLRQLLNRFLPQNNPSQFNKVLSLHRIAHYTEYGNYTQAMLSEYSRRRQLERDLILNHHSFVVTGYCFVCGMEVSFDVAFSYSSVIDGELVPNWREHLKCSGCGLNNRMRAAVHIFEQEFVPHKSSVIYITEQTTPLFQAIRARYPELIASEYLGDSQPFGSLNPAGIRNESITRLSFGNEQFDYILSFDVFEHVPDYTKGFAECLRCLRPGGHLIFTVPFTGKPDTLVRARKNSDGTIFHLLPPEYHGDPLATNGCLCFYHFGWELLDVLVEIGFKDAVALIYWSREFGYLGNCEQIVFTAQKTSK